MTAHTSPVQRLFGERKAAPEHLTPARRAWCRQNLRGFAEYEDAVKAADENAARARRRATGEVQADVEEGCG